MSRGALIPLFASTNAIKIEEVRALVGDVEVWNIELPEIQSVSAEEVVKHKLARLAGFHPTRPVVVEDTALHVDGWNGLPGALVKWFVRNLPLPLLYQILAGDSTAATAVSAVGVLHGTETRIWVGSLQGSLVPPRGGLGGWTPIFEVDGTGLTLGEMTLDERLAHTMRRGPLESLSDWLESHRAGTDAGPA
ncbi:non-canonical purine NTP pyrophosphatase [Amycolatopsis sp. GM8]|uniref:non-canonical purine NTP pyrophosphatase n=1 Tax=Amycolatopsis sp. GM8 TaxID=2896530 RepID=UPI001F31BF72|nr:non-canonical purine NTP pyrophosphatase [Amycolatopsis sp. GM8]